MLSSEGRMMSATAVKGTKYCYHKWYAKKGSQEFSTGFFVYCIYWVRKNIVHGPINGSHKLMAILYDYTKVDKI